jgi:fumarate reductase subunit D
MRPLAITCIDPIISLLIIGPLLWRLVSLGGGDAVSAAGGAVVGVVIGYFRAWVMFVRAEKGSMSVVLKRSAVEYALVFVLIVLRLIEGKLEIHHISAATAGVAALAALGLVEAFARAGFITARYVDHHELPTTVGTTDGPAATFDEAAKPGGFERED